VIVVGLAMMRAKTTGRMRQRMAMISKLARSELRKEEEMMMRGEWVWEFDQKGLTLPQKG
jgi:hypothetical protein